MRLTRRSDIFPGSRRGRGGQRGLTIVELMLGVVVATVIAVTAAVAYTQIVNKGRITQAISDIRAIEQEIVHYEYVQRALPASLDDLRSAPKADPWGRPYRYLDLSKAAPGAARKDRFLVPLNSTFDLYSLGRDGRTKAPLNAATAKDDVVRANDGAYVGLAADY